MGSGRVPSSHASPIESSAGTRSGSCEYLEPMGDLVLYRYGKLKRPAWRCELADVSVGASGEAVALWKHRGSHIASVHFDDGVARAVELERCEARFPMIQPLCTGGFVVADSRCGLDLFTGQRVAINAWVYSSEGAVVGQGSLGDGISHMLVSEAGDLWVGYFDEGVFGGAEVASHGLARFTPELEVAWVYPFGTSFGPIDDCYALNVGGDVAWAYYYSNFPIVRLGNDKVSGWATDLSGGHALLVEGSRALVLGGYENGDRVVRGSLSSDETFHVSETGLLRADEEVPLSGPTRGISRGSVLHMFAGRVWLRAEM